jgi:hypothetical protein
MPNSKKKPSKAETRKSQRAKKRGVEVTKLNNDLNKITHLNNDLENHALLQ